MEEFVLRTEYDRKRLLYIISCLDISKPFRFNWKLWRQKRSLSANSLQHVWYGEISEKLKKIGIVVSPEKVKEDMKHSFLGYETTERVDLGTGEISEHKTLRHSSDLDDGESYHYMCQMQSWAYHTYQIVLTSKNEKDEFAQWRRDEAA